MRESGFDWVCLWSVSYLTVLSRDVDKPHGPPCELLAGLSRPQVESQLSSEKFGRLQDLALPDSRAAILALEPGQSTAVIVEHGGQTTIYTVSREALPTA